MNIETNGDDPAFARVAATNGAVILEAAISDPALDAEYRDAALELADSYLTMTASASKGLNDKGFQDSIEAMTTGQHLLKDLCSG